MNAIDELERVGFFRFAPSDRAGDIREECRRALESAHPNRIAHVDGLGRFEHVDAESLSEQGMAGGLADLAPLLSLRGIEVRRLPTFDVYVSIAGGEWLIVDDEIHAYSADGERTQIDEGVVRVGAERFSLMQEPGNSWLPSARAFCAVVRKLLARASSDERAFALVPGENDQFILLGTDAMAQALRDAGVKRLETWPALDSDPELHAFRLPDDTPIGEADFYDVERLHRDDEDIDAAIELAAADGYTSRYSTHEIIVVPPDLDETTAVALGLADLPRETARYRGLRCWLIDAKTREVATKLVRSLHNTTHGGRRVIAQAARRAVTTKEKR